MIANMVRKLLGLPLVFKPYMVTCCTTLTHRMFCNAESKAMALEIGMMRYPNANHFQVYSDVGTLATQELNKHTERGFIDVDLYSYGGGAFFIPYKMRQDKIAKLL